MITSKTQVEIVRQSALALISCADDYALMKKAVDDMYQVFSNITGVTIDQFNQHNDIMLPSGKAIGMAGAAHCLLEMKRTAVFLRGINKAITLKLSEKKHPIRILYAGTGPYGTLVIPLLMLYKFEELHVDLLDINPGTLVALQNVTETLGLSAYIDEIYCTDASTFTVSKNYDIVISETMQSGLKNEPQVAIMQNLIKQCKADTIFIPEQITIDAYLKKRSIWDADQLLEEGGETNYLCELFSVNKTNLNSSSYRKVVALPQTFNKPYDLLLYTTIRVLDNEVLVLNDCSLNMPLRYFELRENCPKSIEFWYNQSNKPKIEFKTFDYII